MALKDFAPSIVNGAALIGSYLGIGEKRQDRRQVDQQKALNEVNAKTARQQADYEQKLKLKMWQDTNYSAQLKEAEKAGVSKAAAIGGAGAGVGQGASVASPSGGGAADAASAMNAGTSKMMAQAQLGLMTAQKDNLNADTQDKLAGAANKGADTAKKGAETASITQGINNARQVERLTKIQADLAEATQGDNEERIQWEAKRAIAEYERAVSETFVAKQTQDEVIKTIKADAAYGLLRNELTKVGISKTEAEIRKIANDIALGNANIEFQGTDKILGKYVELVAQKILGLGGK